MKKIFFLGLLSVATLVSCDRESELRIVDTSSNAKALLSFGSTNYDFAVEINTTNQMLPVDVNVSTISNVDRTFNVVVEASSDADPQNYTVPASVTIPANAYSGTLMITGNDVTLETTSETATITLVSSDTNVAVGPSSNIRLFQVCPIPSTYMVGNYQITNLATRFGRALIETKVANVTAPTATSRSFTNKLLGETVDRDITLGLVCNSIVMADVSTNLVCTAGNPITYGAATNNSSYDLTDDSTFIVNFNFDVTASCANSAAWVNQSFIMTKIP